MARALDRESRDWGSIPGSAIALQCDHTVASLSAQPRKDWSFIPFSQLTGLSFKHKTEAKDQNKAVPVLRLHSLRLFLCSLSAEKMGTFIPHPSFLFLQAHPTAMGIPLPLTVLLQPFIENTCPLPSWI